MNILLIGASGMIGSRILKEAVSRGHQVIASARNLEKISVSKGVEAIALDVNNADAVAAQAMRVDMIVSAISPRNSGDPYKDAKAFAESLVEVQRATGKRVVMVGGAGTLHLPDGTPIAPTLPDAYRDEAKAMRKVYGLLVSEDIDFTFLAPAGMIMPGERTGNFRIGGNVLLIDNEGNSQISAEDYAVALMDEVETPKHFRTVFTVGY